MEDGSEESPQSGMTKANITGKVPKTMIRPYKGKKRRPLKMTGDNKRQVKSLMKQGAISSKAASFHGLKK